MKKKHRVFIFIIVFVLVIACSLCGYFLTRDSVGFPNNVAYFGMSKTMLVLTKGQPESTDTDFVSPIFTMTYNDEIYGHNCEVVYTFSNNAVFTDLYDTQLTVSGIDYGSARIVFNKVVGNQIKLRSDESGYSYTDYSDDSSNYLKAEINTNNGPSGINFEIEYKNNQLTIHSDYLR